MSHRLTHTALYTAFVGIPLLFLVGVLRVGHALEAPTSVGGRWKMETGGKLAAAISCGPAPEADPIVLRVGQSGPHLRMELRDGTTVPLRGDIDGNDVTAESPQTKPRNRKPGESPTVHLKAQVDRDAKPQALAGTLQVEGCDAAGNAPPSDVPFRAVREVTNGGMF
jgi:hypothetical protein